MFSEEKDTKHVKNSLKVVYHERNECWLLFVSSNNNNNKNKNNNNNINNNEGTIFGPAGG